MLDNIVFAGKGAGCVQKYEKECRVIKYNNNPVKCKYCDKPIPYDKKKNKFCGHSCSASFNNYGVSRNKVIKRYRRCEICGVLTKNKKYCSIKCPSEYKKRKAFQEMERTGILSSSTNRINSYGKEYLFQLRGHQCEDCLLKVWKNQPITLEMHHIDGNPDNNEILNIKLLCPNCHSYTSTSKGKNRKGNGRWSRRNIIRRQRYHEGISS